MPTNKITEYFESIASEIEAVKDRVRKLIVHWPTEGSYKESIVREILSRHLPDSMHITSGFVLTENECTKQIDILIIEKNSPLLYKSDTFVIVEPDSVIAAIEVKTEIYNYDSYSEIVNKLMSTATIIRNGQDTFSDKAWCGLFVINDCLDGKVEQLLALTHWKKSETPHGYINAVSIGGRKAILHDFTKAIEGLSTPVWSELENGWHLYRSEKMAPAQFIYAMLRELALFTDHHTLWKFAQSGCVRTHMIRKPTESEVISIEQTKLERDREPDEDGAGLQN